MTRRQALGGLAVAGVVVWRMAAAQRPPQPALALPPAPEPVPPVGAHHSGFRRRLATSAAFAVLFFAGAALAAGAGNELVSVDDGTTDPALVETTTEATVTTTTEETTTTEALPVETVEADPSDATPAPHVFAPAPTTATVAAGPAPVVQRVHLQPAAHRTVAPAAATPVQSPFPVVSFDPQAWLADHPGSPLGNAAVAIAERFRGVPYRWGGNTPTGGFDCSGLTQYVYAQLGVWLPHYAAAQFLAYPRLDPSELEPGDLVFFEPKADGPGHVAIYAGNGEIVEAPRTGALVRTGSLAGAAASLGFLGAVRPAQLTAPAPSRSIEGRFIAA